MQAEAREAAGLAKLAGLGRWILAIVAFLVAAAVLMGFLDFLGLVNTGDMALSVAEALPFTSQAAHIYRLGLRDKQAFDQERRDIQNMMAKLEALQAQVQSQQQGLEAQRAQLRRDQQQVASEKASLAGQQRAAALYGAMDPGKAAQILANLDEREAAIMVAHLDDKKATAILSNMPPEKAARVLHLLGQGQLP